MLLFCIQYTALLAHLHIVQIVVPHLYIVQIFVTNLLCENKISAISAPITSWLMLLLLSQGAAWDVSGAIKYKKYWSYFIRFNANGSMCKIAVKVAQNLSRKAYYISWNKSITEIFKSTLWPTSHRCFSSKDGEMPGYSIILASYLVHCYIRHYRSSFHNKKNPALMQYFQFRYVGA